MIDPRAGPIPWILWGSLGAAQLLFAILGQTLPVAQAPIEPDLEIVLAAAFAGIALGTVGVAVAWAPRGLASQPYPTFVLVRMALAESIGILGLVLALLGASALPALGLAALGLVTHVLVAPTEADRNRHARGE
jgi:F0F1-type ATP synthase membrane subunit c/vacuolar-type H+-ATPase subunit K